MKFIRTFSFHIILGGGSIAIGGIAGFLLGIYVRRGYWKYPEDSIYASDNFLILTATIGAVLALIFYIKTIREIDRKRGR